MMLPSLFTSDPASPPLLEGVGFWRRAFARGLDLMVHVLIALMVGVLAGLVLGIGSLLFGTDVEAASERLSVGTPLGFLAGILGGLCLHTFSEGIHGSTIGKRICGITVVREDGSAAGLGPAFKRSLLFFVDSLFFGIIAAQKMGQSPQRQRFGDTWAGTVVVRIAELDAFQRRSGVRFAAAVLVAGASDGLIVFLELAARLL